MDPSLAKLVGDQDRDVTHPAPAAVRAASDDPLRRQRLRQRLCVAAIVLLAGGLRFWHVNDPLTDAFSWRQASTAMMADNFYRTSWNIFFPEVSWTGPGPNYQGREFQTMSYTVALLWKVFGGQHDWVPRAVAATFGTWGVLAFYLLVRRVWDEARGLACAAVLAVLPGAVFIDRSFLPDPAMLSLTLTAAWLVVRALQDGDARWRPFVVAGAMSALAFLTKLPGIVALAPMVYAAVVTTRALPPERRKRRATQLLVALAVVLAPVAAYYRWAVHLGSSYPPFHVAGSANWLWKDGLVTWIGRGYYLQSFVGNVTGWLWAAPVIGLVLLGTLVAPPRTQLRWFFHWWLFGCAVLYALGARELSENVWNLHVFNVVAAAMTGHLLVLAATYAGGVAMSAARVGVPVGLVVLAIMVYGQHKLRPFYDTRHARDSRLMGLALRERSQPGDLVVTIAEDVGDPIAIYYSRRRGWVFPQPETTYDRPDPWKPWNLFPQDPKRSIRMFEDLRRKGAKWLGIVAKPKDDWPGSRNFWVDQPEVAQHINRTCKYVHKDKERGWVIYQILTPAELAEREAKAKPAVTQPTTRPATSD